MPGLLVIGFVAGLVTALSPCILPVLPIVLAGSAAGGPRRPYAIVAGLVATFTLSVLFATWLLDRLGLPSTLLHDLAIALLFVVAIALIVPEVGVALERPLSRLTRLPGGDLGGGVLLGASLGLVTVPCAGPVLAAITVVAASRDVGLETALLTCSYAVGIALPLLLFALGGRQASHLTFVRSHAVAVRRALGVVIGATALALALHVDRHFTTAVPGYTQAVQDRVEGSAFARRELAKLTGTTHGPGTSRENTLDDFGAAPPFTGISAWLNTPGDEPLTTKSLRGHPVLVNFWTYTCVNCLRELPHLVSWYAAYRRLGLVVVGVHTPEFAFEHDVGNVRSAVADLGIHYPVAVDNDYGTWNAYANQYWPASYLLDDSGHVRYVHFGEGEYGRTERAIRRLLTAPSSLRMSRTVPDRTPNAPQTPETYLGWQRLSADYAGSPIEEGRLARYVLPPTLAVNGYAYGGRWQVEPERIVAGENARIRIRFQAPSVHLVLAGRGIVDVRVDGHDVRRVTVREDRLYTLLGGAHPHAGLLELRLSPRLAAYAFTFG
jgi:cytochrome c biogenesis protein CcdA/thiol-disulfide isomerase/thioredoxin